MSTLPFGRIAGISLRIHASWAILFALIAVTVASETGDVDPTTGVAARWVIGVAVALGFLASATLHELAHALVARRRGVAVTSIVVSFLGATSSSRLEGARPRDEVAAALAGPLVSIGLGAMLLTISVVGEVIGSGPVVVIGRVALVVGTLDVALGLLNLLPAYPLDGGRVVHALAWARTGDPRAGLRVAARVGRRAGLVVVVVGVLLMLVATPGDGLMIALGGWFLISNAKALERRASLDAVLDGMTVADVMDHDVATIPPGLTIDAFAGQVLSGSASLALPVVRGGELLGMIGARQLRRVRRDRWAKLRAEDLMISPPNLPFVTPETSVQGAIDDLARTNLDGLPVMVDGQLAGVVMRRGVAELVRVRAETVGIHPW
jgi:Zn-dependent protease/CBS domain-containing protein